MLSLILDTSTKYLYLALVKNETVLEEYLSEGSKNHAGTSVYMIDTLLNKHGFSCDDLTDVYCGYGPGSYTGVRISVTIAKMLASFKKVKLHQGSSLFLAGSGYDNLNVAVMFDARRGNYFSACFGQVEIADKLRNYEEFLAMINDCNDLKIVYENDFKVNPLKVMKHSCEVVEIDAFIPNYLRIPEAQYNLEHANDQKSE